MKNMNNNSLQRKIKYEEYFYKETHNKVYIHILPLYFQWIDQKIVKT